MDSLVKDDNSPQQKSGVYELDANLLYLSVAKAGEIGRRYANEYQSNKPYNYICIDNFLPHAVCQALREEALKLSEKAPEHSSPQEHLKAAYNPDTMSIYVRSVFGALNSLSFLSFLEEMTGIRGLIPDPYYKGGGIHRTNNGGYLGVHADFNHHKQMNLERRLNVLIYLNPDWKPEYGGAFEIWTDDMKEQVAVFTPVMNRMCCFSTSSTSMHGNPTPVNHPSGSPRISVALYYYTATWTESHVSHSTLFRPRPGSGDKINKTQNRIRIAHKYTPPVIHDFVARMIRRIGA